MSTVPHSNIIIYVCVYRTKPSSSQRSVQLKILSWKFRKDSIHSFRSVIPSIKTKCLTCGVAQDLEWQVGWMTFSNTMTLNNRNARGCYKCMFANACWFTSHACLSCQIPRIRTTNRGTHVSCSAYEQGLGPSSWQQMHRSSYVTLLCATIPRQAIALFRETWVEEQQQISSLGSVDKDPHCRNIFY